jgi:hypothetical protein
LSSGLGFVVDLLSLLSFLNYAFDDARADGAGESDDRDTVVEREYIAQFINGFAAGVDKGLGEVGARCCGKDSGMSLDLDLREVSGRVMDEYVAAAWVGDAMSADS